MSAPLPPRRPRRASLLAGACLATGVLALHLPTRQAFAQSRVPPRSSASAIPARARAETAASSPLSSLPAAPLWPPGAWLVPRRPVPLQPPEPRPRTADAWHALGVRTRASGNLEGAAQAFAEAALISGSAASWRALGDVQTAQRDYLAAELAYSKAAARYSALGQGETALALQAASARFSQTCTPMLLAPPRPAARASLARLEPPAGMLLGMYAGANVLPPGQAGFAPELAPFPVLFRYWSLSASTDPARVFPGRFVRAAAASGKAVHLALEPGMPLSEVSDAVIDRFVTELAATRARVFVRFASEMNDPKNEWGRDPELYRRTFARMAAAVHARAPEAAMVWMPMPGDLSEMAPYYPGEAAVDWVGLSLYSVPFENGDLSRPQDGVHALAKVDAFYRRYSLRHPVQLSEYAASHRSGAQPGVDRSAYALQQMREVYWGSLSRYPRLKYAGWLDLDMFTEVAARPGQLARRNDYRLLAHSGKRAAMAELQAFLAPEPSGLPALLPSPWPAAVRLSQVSAAGLRGVVDLELAEPATRVQARLISPSGQVRALGVVRTLPHAFAVPRGALSAGRWHLEVQAAGSGGLLLASCTQAFIVSL